MQYEREKEIERHRLQNKNRDMNTDRHVQNVFTLCYIIQQPTGESYSTQLS